MPDELGQGEHATREPDDDEFGVSPDLTRCGECDHVRADHVGDICAENSSQCDDDDKCCGGCDCGGFVPPLPDPSQKA